jgi:hypothetical protein
LAEAPKDQESVPTTLTSVSTVEEPKTRKAFSQAKRLLTDEELAAPAAQKMLLDELDRLEAEKAELVQYRARFYEVDRECAVLRENQKGNLASDLLSLAGMTLVE